MSGLEIAGLVLGAFPILLNVRDYYKRGRQPLDEFLHFENELVDLLDDIDHEKMVYEYTMNELLKSITCYRLDGNAMLHDIDHPNWKNPIIEEALRDRLSVQYDRFLRVIVRMQKTQRNLCKILGIENGEAAWLNDPLQALLRRFRICSSSTKQKQIAILRSDNEKLRGMVGCSEQLAVISGQATSNQAIAIFERVRQQACKVNGALDIHWNCGNVTCKNHQASLRLNAQVREVRLHLLFAWEDTRLASIEERELEARPTFTEPPSNGPIQPTGSVQSQVLRAQATAVQGGILNKLSIRTKTSNSKNVSFVKTHTVVNQPSTTMSAPTPRLIRNLCESLRDRQTAELGIIQNNSSEEFYLASSSGAPNKPQNSSLMPLSALLEANSTDQLDMTREQRFSMAANVAGALLQVQRSPWLSKDWTKKEIYFLASSDQTASIVSANPYVSRTYPAGAAHINDTDWGSDTSAQAVAASAKITRSVLFRLGVIILELIFGCTIESTRHYKYYLKKAESLPENEIELLAARKWEGEVLGNSGAHIQSVVHRCLWCSFEPEEDFKERRFREAVFQNVVKPLLDYNKSQWPQ